MRKISEMTPTHSVQKSTAWLSLEKQHYLGQALIYIASEARVVAMQPLRLFDISKMTHKRWPKIKVRKVGRYALGGDARF